MISITPKKIIITTMVIACAGGVFVGGAFFGRKMTYQVPQSGTIDFSLFWDSYNKLQQNFFDPSKIDSQKIIYGAIEGMAKSLDDPYTSFFNPEEAQKFMQDLSGSFEGIGAEIGIKTEQLTIVAPLEGSPAQASGIKAGDVIIKIDNTEASDLTTDEAVGLIRGAKGTVVTLTIFRTGWSAAKDFKITRDTIIVHPAKWSLKNGNVAYIQITQFDENLVADFQKTVAEILQSPAEKIVLDLRNNPGGYLEVAQNIAGWFLEKGQIVTIEDFGGKKEQQLYKSDGTAELLGYPIVVLINEGSASASEILAGSIRDNKGAKLIGTKSFGKGSVQEILDLRGGSFLKITIAKWLTPKGASISEVGLSPDVKVDITDEDVEQDKDPQLDKALEIVKSIPTGK